MSAKFDYKLTRLANRMLREREATGTPSLVLVLGSAVMPIPSIERKLLKADGINTHEIDSLSPFQRNRAVAQAWQNLVRGDQVVGIVRHIEEAFMIERQNPVGITPGYGAIAQLVERGYFDIVLTADFSTRLEDALVDRRILKRQWKTYPNCDLFDQYQFLHLATQPFPRIKVFKLSGDLFGQFAFAEADLITCRARAQLLLQAYLGRPLLVVGYDDTRDAWAIPVNGGTIHFVHEEEPQPNWKIYQALIQRVNDDNLFSGTEATLDVFAPRLRDRLLGGEEPNTIGLETYQNTLKNFKDLEADHLAQAISNGNLVELLEDRRKEASGTDLVEIERKVLLSIHIHSDRRLSFKISGDNISHQSEPGRELTFDLADLNETLYFLGQDIERYYRDMDIAALGSWRQRMKREGKRLYQELLAGNDELMRMWGMARQASGRSDNLHVSFLGPRGYLGMPYEILHDGVEHLSLQFPVSRCVTGIASDRPDLRCLIRQTIDEPLRILLIASNTDPTESTGIDAEGEVRELREVMNRRIEAIGLKAVVDCLLTDEASLKEVEQRLEGSPYHIIHYAGHGEFEPMTGERSGLVFWSRSNRRGKVVALRATRLSQLLRNSKTVFLYLNCCVGTVVSNQDLLRSNDYLGLADAIVQAGIPGVLGYRWSIRDESARRFAIRFYQELFASHSLEQATLKARRDLYGQNPDDETWTSPILVIQNPQS